MTSTFFSNILTTTSSKYTNLRRQLISSEADGDTEDDSHISRVLRAYYIEKARAFPQWLPPDPKAPPPPAPTQFVSSHAQQGQTRGQGPGQQPQGGRTWGRGGLSDLWDGGNKQQAQEPESLRQRPGLRGSNNASSFDSQASTGSAPASRFAQTSYINPEASQAQGRPLPSQRQGSYQSQFSSRFGAATETSPPPSAGSGISAQDRLKSKLWGTGRSGSPTPSTASASSATSPAPSVGGRNPYDTSENSRFGGGGQRGAGNQDAGRGYGGGSGGSYGGGSGDSSRPPVSASSPWSGGDDYTGGGGRGDGRATGLPSGPRAGRQGLGLPSGPRPKR